MDQWTEQPRAGELFEVGTRLRESSADAHHGSDEEASADEGVQRDAARHDVPSRLFPGKVNSVERLRLDQRQLVAVAGPAESAPTAGVSIALEPASRDRYYLVDGNKGCLRIGCDQEPGHRAGLGGGAV